MIKCTCIFGACAAECLRGVRFIPFSTLAISSLLVVSRSPDSRTEDHRNIFFNGIISPMLIKLDFSGDRILQYLLPNFFGIQ